MPFYIHQSNSWPHFTWDEKSLLTLLAEVRHLQGYLMGKASILGFELKDNANLENLVQDVLRSSEIEGEHLNAGLVRSSIAVRLGLEDSGPERSDRYIDGMVDMMLDATQNNNKRLDPQRLFGWHAALFPGGRSGMVKVEAGCWRSGEMQVVSGPMGRERVHFHAPAPEWLEKEMKTFIRWFNSKDESDPVLKAAVAHLWFITIHPFDDGNGRIARAITDMQLSLSDGMNQRFYSMSAQVKKEKKAYYSLLEKTQRGNLDITGWIYWFLSCLKKAILSSSAIMDKVLRKHSFWAKHAAFVSNERQRKMLNKLLDGFKGHLTSSKWAKITKTSPDTALRDINDLVKKGILKKAASGGRSTHYLLTM